MQICNRLFALIKLLDFFELLTNLLPKRFAYKKIYVYICVDEFLR